MSNDTDTTPFLNRTGTETSYFEERQNYLADNKRFHAQEYVDQPFVFCSRQALTSSLFRIKLYEKILEVHGAIVECGVHRGNNFMLFNQLASIYEPHNLTRQIIGFDTFGGFASIDGAVDLGATDAHFSDSNYTDIAKALALHDRNRPVPNVPRGELVKGDAVQTIPDYVARNPHLIVALLYIDFDIYKPCLAALQHIVPLMPKGAIIAFDEANVRHWPGETRALKEFFDLNKLRIRRMPFEAYASYAVIE
jgi:hypothetical protein